MYWYHYNDMMYVCIILFHLLYLDAVRFAKETDKVAENEGPIMITLRLDRPATERLTISINATDITATGELYTVYMDILRY